ncbi:MAG: ABC transporter permease, partial [Chthoniobacteraceae bacterium]|nr:ABC transporter permease [Chthoniobacteraceae bacterium]
LGSGLLVAALMVSYRDVNYFLPVAVQLLLYASPVAYAVSAVPPALRGLYWLNPLCPLLEGFRWSLLGAGTLPPGPLLYAAAISCTAMTAGAFAFKWLERLFSDVI